MSPLRILQRIVALLLRITLVVRDSPLESPVEAGTKGLVETKGPVWTKVPVGSTAFS
jgi:hypothetical protein